ncbi:MAG: serine/threonine-protein kinase [Kofleriaceae bacterium]
MPNPAVGTLLGAYRVEGLLGSGSMGEVYRGVDVGLNRRVAIKILSDKHRDSAELRARFVREGRAVAAVSHPNVVQVFATGTFDERPYIAMEFLDGTDLGSLVEREGPLDDLAAVRAVFDAASGLEAASRAGLIHRDVKPSNLVRLTDGTVKVTDFGLAKPVDPGAEPALTAMGVVVGTPDYIAPEQARGEAIDERVDIYALGGSLYFLLTKVPPFRTGKPGEDKYLKVVARHLRQPPPSAVERNGAIDRELSALAQEMMAKRPDDRPGYPDLLARLSAIALRLDPTADALGARGSRPISIAMISRPPGAPPVGVSLPPGASRAAPPPSLGPRAPEPPRPVAEAEPGLSLLPPPALPRWSLAVTALSLALFVAGLVVYLGRSSPTEATAPPSNADAPGAVVDAAPPADAATPPAPPAGMILVTDPSGAPQFYVDARPVAVTAFRAVFADHRQERSGDDAPAVSVSYTAARSYARTAKARLLTAEEWDRASTMPGFVVVDGLFEWIESEGAKRTAKKHGQVVERKDQEQPDVTFRLAREL